MTTTTAPVEALRLIVERTANPAPTSMSDRKVLDWVNGQARLALEALTASPATDEGEKLRYPWMSRSMIEQWIEKCNHEPARETLRHYIELNEARPVPATDDIGRLVEELQEALVRVEPGYIAPLPRETLARIVAALLSQQSEINRLREAGGRVQRGTRHGLRPETVAALNQEKTS